MEPENYAVAEGFVTQDGALTDGGLESFANLEGLKLVDSDGNPIPFTVRESFTMRVEFGDDPA